jgi:hypothetical protein
VEDEQWLPVIGFEQGYKVSSLGNVWSVPRMRRGGGRLIGGYLLRPAVNTGGYLFVQLCRDGKRYNRVVHLLVLEAFAGPRPDGCVARHGPAGQQDNSIGNLCYGTEAENMMDKIRDGTDQLGRRRVKLSWPIATEARARYEAGGESIRSLALEYGVQPMTMWKLLAGKSWKLPVTTSDSGHAASVTV